VGLAATPGENARSALAILEIIQILRCIAGGIDERSNRIATRAHLTTIGHGNSPMREWLVEQAIEPR
jgi:hypothetical protein